ncbi:MAG: 50S ribosomal protein L31e [Candidatus Thermoplasmatota archaeon]
MAEKERVYIIPLRIPRRISVKRRVPHAIERIKSYVARHMKANRDKIWIDQAVNEKLWRRGIEKCQKNLKIRAVKFEDELVEVSLPEAKEKKEEIEEKEEKEEEKKE